MINKTESLSQQNGDSFLYYINHKVKISNNGKFEESEEVTCDLNLLFCDALCVFMDDVYRNKSLTLYLNSSRSSTMSPEEVEKAKKIQEEMNKDVSLEDQGYELAKLVTTNNKEIVLELINDFYQICEKHNILKINKQEMTYDIVKLLSWHDKRELFLRFCGFFFKISNGSCQF